MTRSRGWVQDKLWSNRSQRNGANSLRQVLYQLRKALGPTQDVLTADRRQLRLDASRVKLIQTGVGEILEGLDINDPEFEIWLSGLRAQANAGRDWDTARTWLDSPVQGPAAPARVPAKQPPLRQLMIEQANEGQSLLGRFETRIGDSLARSLREHLDLVLVAPGQEVGSQGLLALNVSACREGESQIGLRVAVYEGLGQGASWADSVTGSIPSPGAPPGWPFRHLCHRACDAIVGLLTKPGSSQDDTSPGDANSLAGAAVRRMFSMLPGSVDEARDLLHLAHKLRPRGLYLAWQAQLAVIDFVESEGVRREELAELADELCAKAMSDEGTNSNVLAAVSHARLVFDNDLSAALELSHLGVVANPENPLAWSARANALLNAEQTEKAYRAAHAAHRLASNTNLRFWTDFQIATTAIAAGRTEEAIDHAERSRALNARYRPALRYLIGLHAEAGDLVAARRSLHRLQRVEPTLTIEDLVLNDGYPVSMMRRAGLIDPHKFSDL